MGVILKLMYRGDELSEQSLDHLFLDMEENIHIHYRDLRMEFSREEFEEFARVFAVQSRELLDEAARRGYRDGVLPNTNREAVRVWTDSRLEAPVRYHPRRLSVERCADGYHLHYRNYKLLLSEADFGKLTEALSIAHQVQDPRPNPGDVVALIEHNDIPLSWAPGPPSSRGADTKRRMARVDLRHANKLYAILEGVGLKSEQDESGDRHFKGDDLIVTVRAGAAHVTATEDVVIPLETFLALPLPMNPDRLNLLKATVLQVFSRARKRPAPVEVNLDWRAWLYRAATREVVLPYLATPMEVDAGEKWRQWQGFLKSRHLDFVKPSKSLFEPDEQSRIYSEVVRRIRDESSRNPAVARVYLMGSATRGQLGAYRAPFIHGRSAKLGSDIDILVELDDIETPLPATWKPIAYSERAGCDIYHLGEIPARDLYGFRARFPDVNFHDHLLDAYVYRPGRGDPTRKNAFLKRFMAESIYERDDQISATVRDAVRRGYGEGCTIARKLAVSSENSLYEVSMEDGAAVLKICRVAGNHASSRRREHAAYECRLMRELAAVGADAPLLVPTKDGEDFVIVDGDPAFLIRPFDKAAADAPPVGLCEAARGLADIHDPQLGRLVEIDPKFSFDDVMATWSDAFWRFEKRFADDAELAAGFARLRSRHLSSSRKHRELLRRPGVKAVHVHGDVQPRNVMRSGDTIMWFDYQNAYWGPRIYDVAEGALEFALAPASGSGNTEEERFVEFVRCYDNRSALSADERVGLPDAIAIVGTVKFVKEVRMIKDDRQPANGRRVRALALCGLLERLDLPDRGGSAWLDEMFRRFQNGQCKG